MIARRKPQQPPAVPATDATFGTVTANRIVIPDSEGRERITLDVDSQDVPVVKITGGRHDTDLILTIHATSPNAGAPCIMLGHGGNAAMMIDLDEDGRPSITMMDPDDNAGSACLEAGLNRDGRPELILKDKNRKKRLALSLGEPAPDVKHRNPGWEPDLTMWDEAGEAYTVDVEGLREQCQAVAGSGS